MSDWIKLLSAHTILHAENDVSILFPFRLLFKLINQAEEMIAKATLDKYATSMKEGKADEQDNNLSSTNNNNNNTNTISKSLPVSSNNDSVVN